MAKEPKDAAAAPDAGAKAAASKRKKEFRKKKEKRVVPHGVVNIQATFNNTIVTLTDPDGRTVSWATAGSAWPIGCGCETAGLWCSRSHHRRLSR